MSLTVLEIRTEKSSECSIFLRGKLYKFCTFMATKNLLPLVLNYNAIPVKGVTRVMRRILIWLWLVEPRDTVNQCLFPPSYSGG